MTKRLRINLVNYESAIGKNAILTKYARMMERELLDTDHEAIIAPVPQAGYINHHINFVAYTEKFPGKNTTMITHLSGDKTWSEQLKMALVKKQEEWGTVGICFNQEMKEKLIKDGRDGKKLFVSGHAHDSVPRRPIIIALVFNIYPDGRKREEMLVKLFDFLKKHKAQDRFVFRVMGQNWKELLERMIKKGLKQAQYTDVFTGDLYQEFLSTSDFLLYTGDEDSLGQSVIDAKQAGLRVIAPPRKEFTVEYPFKNQDELNQTFLTLAEDNEVKDWTWNNFVKKHIAVWEKL